MLDKLAQIEARYEELERLLADPAVNEDYEQIARYSKERADLQELVDHYREYTKQLQDLEDARTLFQEEDDAEMRELARVEVAELEASTEALHEKLKMMLLPKDPRDDKNVIVEIRAGAGGDEAALFAADLFRMYVPVMLRRAAGKSTSSTSTRPAAAVTSASSSRSRARGPSAA
jgi:peptide chain release factor 1